MLLKKIDHKVAEGMATNKQYVKSLLVEVLGDVIREVENNPEGT